MKKLYLILGPIAIGIAICVFCSFNTGTGKAAPVVNKIKFRIADTTPDLPRQYKQRKFLNDVAGISYDLLTIPGNIVTFHPKDTSYEFRTMRGLIKGNLLPVSNALGYDGILYSGLITANTSFNGSHLIGGVRAEKDEVMEITIRDVVISTVPDSLVDIDAIKTAIKDIPAEELKNMFYVKAATVSVIESKKYKLSKFDIAKNAFYITRDGKTYSTQDKSKADKVLSMFLVPLDRLSR